MKIQIVWSYYDSYLQAFYAKHPGIDQQSYQTQADAFVGDFFCWPTYLAPEFRLQGHETEVVIANARPLQGAWARECALNGTLKGSDWREIAVAQVRRFRPDVLWLQGNQNFLGAFLSSVRSSVRAVVAWNAEARDWSADWRGVDLVLSSHDNLVAGFRSRGLSAKRLLPCFSRSVLDAVHPAADKRQALLFTGSLVPTRFSRRLRVLCGLRGKVPLEILGEIPEVRFRPWRVGSTISGLRLAALRRSGIIKPAVFGKEMFTALAQYAVCLNVHTDAAADNAGNIRLFEATGIGTSVLTDQQTNIASLFASDEEVVTFSSTAEAVEKARFLLEHAEARNEIARRAQRRTLVDHSSEVRAHEALDIFTDLTARAKVV